MASSPDDPEGVGSAQTVEVFAEDLKDLGFGARVAIGTGERLLNQDGTFNLVRYGLPFFRSRSPYHAILTMRWSTFMALVVGGYLGIATLFAIGYVAAGPGALGAGAGEGLLQVVEAFFFSVPTLTTVGYGHLYPASVTANVLATAEAFVGLAGFALVAALMFARLSRPTSQILFSHQAIVAPYYGGFGFEFRIANGRRNQLLEVNVRVVFTLIDRTQQNPHRRFYEIALERSEVAFFPLSWTVVHPITRGSPLFGRTSDDLVRAQAEFLVLVSAIDETSEEIVHARSSYRAEEIVWGARFSEIFERSTRGIAGVDLRHIHDIESVAGFHAD